MMVVRSGGSVRGRGRLGRTRKGGGAAVVVVALEGETVADRVEGGSGGVVGSGFRGVHRVAPHRLETHEWLKLSGVFR